MYSRAPSTQVLAYSQPKRARIAGRPSYVGKKPKRAPKGPPGTTRRYVSRTVRDMPLHAPYAASKPEMKYVDSGLLNWNMSVVGTIGHVNVIGTGSSIVGQREGARVTICGVQIRGYAQANAGPLALGTLVLVYDRQPQGAIPLITDIYTAITPTSYAVSSARDRFQILGRWDYKFVGPGVAPTNESALQQIQYTVACRKDSVYDNTGLGAIVNMTTGGLYLLSMGDQVALGAPFAVLNVRVMYGDN